MVKNSQGKVYYGMHFYPGVAEYCESGKDAYRVFLNEDTIRAMDPTFAGRPIYVEHVDEVNENLDELRKEADGWVVESFYNAADGKHWAKFIVVSERGERAIRSGMKLSNAYIPKNFGDGGLWNGVTYTKEIKGGEYEHLAIVRNPRYEESVIMTPDEFKSYNEQKVTELKRLANSKDKKEKTEMKFKWFKREKLENSADLEGMTVVLPKSGKEMTVSDLVEGMDKIVNMHGYANGDHMVKVGEDEMSVNDLLKKHMDMCNEVSDMKKMKEEEGAKKNEEDKEKDKKENEDKDDEKKKEEKKENEEKDDKKDKKENEDEEKKEDKKKNELSELEDAEGKKRAEALKNAHLQNSQPMKVELSEDRVARGKVRYGSN